ncbi:MAG: polysaccharide pyruvyl transferase family protein [Candidatus Bathyarchaeota archaeon]|nr:polysaccharide pyruvyl transferase family protein [Candidatus Bathyarchaeota archaeon]
MKPLPQSQRFNILITNFWTERNKGDAALQISLIRMLREQFGDAKITVCSAFGANQINLARKETCFSFDESIDDFVGGLQPTYHETETASHRNNLLNNIKLKIRALFTLSLTLFFLANLAIGVPSRLLSHMLPPSFRKTLQAYSDAHLIVMRPKNIREPSYLTGPLYLYYVYYPALVGLLMHKPVVFVGGSVWPLKNPLSVALTRFVFERLFLITVREHLSYVNLTRGLRIKNTHVYEFPDLSFYMLNDFNKRLKTIRMSEKPLIGLTIVDWIDRGETARQAYLKSLQALILYVARKYEAQFVVLPQVTFAPQETTAILKKLTAGECANYIQVIRSELSVEALLKLYSRLDFLVATRLHSAVFASSVGVPILAITYEGGPKARGILGALGLKDSIVDYAVEPSVLISRFEELWSKRTQVTATAQENFPKLYQNVTNHVLVMKQRLAETGIY